MGFSNATDADSAQKGSFIDSLNSHWSEFTASPMRVLALALCLSLFFCGVTELTWVKADLNDDYTIASVLSGRLMGEQGLCLFVNAILSNVIYGLNTLYPHFNWFAVLELLTVFVSYTVICYVVIRYLPIHAAFLAIALVAYFTLPGCFTINNFTYVAFICSCAGCMLLCRSLSLDRHDPIDLVAGLVLLSIGSLWRNIMAWLCVPIFGIAAIAIVVKKHTDDDLQLGKSIARLWPFILAVVIGFGLTVYDLAVWKASPWDEWRTYNDERSMLSDFPHYKYDEIEDELKELGISRNDYQLLFSWTTEDPEFFTTERVEQLVDVAIINWVSDKSPVSIAKGYAKNILNNPEVAILLLGTLIAGLAISRGRARIWSVVVIAMALLMAVFFSAMGRLPERVHYPILLYALCAICMLQIAYEQPRGQLSMEFRARHGRAREHAALWPRFANAACLILICAPLCAGAVLVTKCVDNFAPQRIAITFNADADDIGGPFTDYIHSHPDNVFVLHNTGHRQLRMEHSLKAYYDDQLQFQVVSLGGWLTRSPYNNAKNASLDMENPLKGLADNKKALLVVSSETQAERIGIYIQEHYYPNARYELVDTLTKRKGYGSKLLVYRYYAE